MSKQNKPEDAIMYHKIRHGDEEGGRDLVRQLRITAIKSAAAAILARNQSHGIGAAIRKVFRRRK